MNLRFQLYLVGEAAAAAGIAGDRGRCTRRQELGLGVQRLRTGLVIIVILLGDLAHRVQAVSVQDSVALEPSDGEDHLVPDM